MSRWLRFTRVRCLVQPRQFQSRFLSSQSSIEHVRVPCASTGDITVSLHNIDRQDTSSPLIILIPPISQPRPGAVAPVPGCFHDYPTAVINYRWQLTEEEEPPEIPLHWPTPLHDVNFGYSWIMENLGSGTDPRSAPRPAYVYGSYLGASLAAGLALTESHVPIRSLPMTIRGLMAHNGIYNWTMFLPDHPIHKAKPVPNTKRKNNYTLYTSHDGATEEEGIFSDLKAHAPTLFRDPSNLFDPFASACLFFQTAHLHVPDDFTTPLSDSDSDALEPSFRAAIDALANRPSPPTSTSTSTPEPLFEAEQEQEQKQKTPPPSAPDQPPPASEEEKQESAHALLARAARIAKLLKPARSSYLTFPPLYNTRRLPYTLLVHSAPHTTHDSNSSSSSSNSSNFAVQADALARLMMRSLDMYEFGKRGYRPGTGAGQSESGSGSGNGSGRWGEGAEDGGERVGEVLDSEERERAWRERWDAIERRVQTFEVAGTGVGAEEGPLGLDGEGEAVVGDWLRERIEADWRGRGQRGGGKRE